MGRPGRVKYQVSIIGFKPLPIFSPLKISVMKNEGVHTKIPELNDAR